jgi:pimeloyl-ACP methyl ester carboxylesterase
MIKRSRALAVCVPAFSAMLAIFAVSFVPSPALAGDKSEPGQVYEREFKFGIELRPGVMSKVVVTGISDRRVFPVCAQSGNVLVVPGLAHSASAFRPWAEQIFSDKKLAKKVGTVFLMDLPGHGKSEGPIGDTGIKFGDLSLSDYATTVNKVLARLSIRGCFVDTIVAHSMGGIVSQMAQESLLSKKLSLRKLYGVKDVVLVASNFPRELPWYFGDSGIFAQIAPLFLKTDAELGTYFEADLASWMGLFLTNPLQQLAPATPSPTDIVVGGYMSKEPLVAALELGGIPPLARPSVRAGAFARKLGTDLSVVAMEQDIYSVYPSEQTALLAYLKGVGAEEAAAELKTITGANSVHDVMLTDAAALNAILADVVNSPRGLGVRRKSAGK